MSHLGGVEAGPAPVDPVLGFIRRELAASPERWIGSLTFAGLALLGVIATVTFLLPSPVLVFAGILMLSVPRPRHPFGQAVAVTGASGVGAGAAILLAVTAYDQPWLYLPLQCGALTGLLVLSRVTDVRAGFILAAMILSFAEPAYLASPEAAISAALFNALSVAGTAWIVAAAQSILAAEKIETLPTPPFRLSELTGFSVLALTAIGLQMLFYNTIGLPEIRTGVIAVLLTADTDLRGVFQKMPVRQLCAAICAFLALLLIAVGAPVMDDLGFFALLAASAYFTSGWVAHGSPRIAFACVPGAVAVTLVLLLDFRFVIDIVPSLLGVAGVLWGMFVTAVIALLLSRLGERRGGLDQAQLPDVPAA
jgi:hypothetical protein